jgi:hypothetical protein
VNTGGTVNVTGGGSVQVGNPTKSPSGAVNIGSSGQVVNSGTINGNVNIDAGGGLVGRAGVNGTITSTVNGNVTDGGLVAPNDPQTMTINGNYTQLVGRLDLGVKSTPTAVASGLDLSHAPIDGEIDARDERAFIGSKEQNCASNFFGGAPAPLPHL